ncbi:MAG: hypothetical protein VB093_06930, partial [Propionicimonas sp.]|nr:hypothetical protein [Propionicimonas sp.]
MNEVWIVAHDRVGGEALASSARTLAGQVNAVSLGAGGLAAADLTLTIDTASSAAPVEAYATAVANLLSARGATVVLFDAGTQGRLLAGLVAAQLGVSPVNAAAVELADRLTVQRLAFGGLAVATEQITSPVAVLVIGPGVLPATEVAGEGAVEAVAARPAAGLTV